MYTHKLINHYKFFFKRGEKNKLYNENFLLFLRPPLSIIFLKLGSISFTVENQMFHTEGRKYVSFSKTLIKANEDVIKLVFLRTFYRTKVTFIEFWKHAYNRGRVEAVLLSKKKKYYKVKISFSLPKIKFYLSPFMYIYLLIQESLYFLGFCSELSLITYKDITKKDMNKINNDILVFAMSIVIDKYLFNNFTLLKKITLFALNVCVHNNIRNKDPLCYICSGREFWIRKYEK